MSQTYLDKLFKEASGGFKGLNPDLHAGSARAAAKLELHPQHGALGPVQVQGPTGQRFLVRLTAFRSRLLDEDNLCEKYHVDLCRYAGVLPDDRPGQAKIEVRQVKTGKGEPERTLIEVYRSDATTSDTADSCETVRNVQAQK